MNSKEYERLRQQIEDRYKADLAALERVRSLSGDFTSEKPDLAIPTIEELTDKVKGLLPELNGDVITKRTVMAKLRETEPATPKAVQDMLGAVLRRLDGTELQLHRKGSGKRASEYRVRHADDNGAGAIAPDDEN
jgi:hypothetical protein